MKNILFAIFTILFFSLVIHLNSCMEQEKQSVFSNADTICLEDSFSVKDFVLELHLQEIKYPDIVLRQACWESGFFSSKIWREKNNPFGFYHSIDSIHGEYILFNDWRSAITYYKDWQDKRYKGGDYYEFLIKVGYAQDSNYVKSVRGIDLSNLKNIK